MLDAAEEPGVYVDPVIYLRTISKSYLITVSYHKCFRLTVYYICHIKKLLITKCSVYWLLDNKTQ